MERTDQDSDWHIVIDNSGLHLIPTPGWKGYVKILMAASCISDRSLGVSRVVYALADQYRAMGHEVRMRFRSTSWNWSTVA